MTFPDITPSLGELARRIAEVLGRFEALALKVETNYITKEVFKLSRENSQTKRDAQDARIEVLEDRINALEQDKAWLVRLVIGAVVMAVLGAGFAASKALGS